MRKLIEIKPWLLFLIIVIPVLIGQILNLSGNIAFYLGLFSLIVFLSWTFSIVRYGHKLFDKLNLKRYNFTLFTLVSILIPALTVVNRIIKPDTAHKAGLLDIIYLIDGLLVVLFFLHVIFIAVKTIINIEKKEEATFMEWIGYMLLMIAFVFGIWIIQPKVNKHIGKKPK